MTKLHAAADALGSPHRLILGGGHAHDLSRFEESIAEGRMQAYDRGQGQRQ